jgi:transcriptional regulator with XRE-family HTH domain
MTNLKYDKEVKAPYGSNRLAIALGQKLRRVRELRWIAQTRLAAQLGCSVALVAQAEQGKILAGPNFWRRVLQWMKGVTFEEAPPLSEATYDAKVKSADWRKHSVMLPNQVRRAYAKRCAALGMSPKAVTILLIKNFLANEALLLTMKDAYDAIQESRITAALDESPEIRDILKIEIPIAVRAGATLTKWKDLEPPPALAFLEAPEPVAPEVDATPAPQVHSLIQEEVDEDDV